MRLFIYVASALAAGAIAATAAAATNVAPNPGFESCSAGAEPAGWAGGFSTTLTCDGDNPASGSWSAKEFGSGNEQFGGGGSAISDCFTSGISGGATYDISFSYRTTDPNTSSVTMFVEFFSGTACSGFLGDRDLTAFAMTDGQWHQAAKAITAPAGAKSADLFVNVDCNSCTTGSGRSATANLDDVVVATQALTAAAFRSLAATATRAGTSVSWRTASEVNVAGFNVYRSWHGKRVRVNQRLIPAANAARGHSYRYLDRVKARPGARYWIQAVDLDASVNWYGAAIVAARA